MLILLLSFFSFYNTIDFAQIFGRDYEKAIEFCKKHQNQLEGKCKIYGLSKKELYAVVFPELIRHSSYQDFFETKALEFAYVSGGAAVADFSIGHFQMKPSFVEEIEKEIEKNEKLKADFEHLLEYSNINERRSIRIERLKSIEWQMDYLCCFYAIVIHKFQKEINELSQENKIKFIATAYNCGFNKDSQTIKKWMEIACYPFGSKYPQSKQYIYADVAWDYYKKN